MPNYKGMFNYIGNIQNIDFAVNYQGVYLPNYKSRDALELPLSIQENQFPEDYRCAVCLDQTTYNNEFDPTVNEHLFVYTQNRDLADKMISRAKYKAVSGLKVETKQNDMKVYRWTQKNVKGNKYEIILIYDPNRTMTRGKIVPLVVALVIGIALIIAGAVCFCFWIWSGQQAELQKNQQGLDAMRAVNTVEVRDANGNLRGYLYVFGNGSAHYFDLQTGEWEQVNEGMSWDDWWNKIKPQETGKGELYRMLPWVIGGICALGIVLLFVYAFMKARKEEPTGLKEVLIEKPVGVAKGLGEKIKGWFRREETPRALPSEEYE